MIAYLSHRFPAGSETFTYDEVVALAAAGLAVEVISFRPGEPLGWPLDGIAVETLPSLDDPVYARALAWWLVRRPHRLLLAAALVVGAQARRRVGVRERAARLAALPRGALLARRSGVTLYHAQFAEAAASAALVASLLSGRSFSFRSHTAPQPDLLRAKLARAAVVLSISEHDRARLLAVEPGARVELSRLGVASAASAAPPAGRDPTLVAAVGSLIEKKGHHVLIEAVARLRAQGIAVRCEIAGEGPWRARLEELVAERGLAGCVVLRGALPREEAIALLAAARVAVLASVSSAREGEDGIPVSLMEALAHGTPCVASRLSGVPELVVDGETGLLVPPGDADALAAALARLLADEALAGRLGEGGRRLVRERFDRDACFRRAAALLGAAQAAAAGSSSAGL